jgi:myo-inositol-1(or 4)-monophosphatase
VFEVALWRFEDLRRPGAASLDLAYSAAGVWDGFFELGLALWDIAAGALLVTEAGGVVSDWSGDQAAVYRSGDILAGSPAWHEAMLDVIATAGVS